MWVAKAWSKSKLLWAVIWLNRVAMIFSYVMLDIRSISFRKHKNIIKVQMIWNSYPKPYVVFIAKPSTYATCYLIELCQIVVTLSEIHFILPWSRSRTHFHHMQYFYTRSKHISIDPQNKTPCSCMTLLSLKNMPRIWDYIKRKIKWCIPKEGMPHTLACHKKKNKRCIPKEGMPHA